MKATTYQVTYTKAIGTTGTILVKARNEHEAICNAKNCCYTGRDFRNPVVTNQPYVKPSANGFAGSNRQK